MELTIQETCQVLAALRRWQGVEEEWVQAVLNDSGQTPMTDDEIDDLCEKINTAKTCKA